MYADEKDLIERKARLMQRGREQCRSRVTEEEKGDGSQAQMKSLALATRKGSSFIAMRGKRGRQKDAGGDTLVSLVM